MQKFGSFINEKSDISEHLLTIFETCRPYKHITECGLRKGKSTIAILASTPNKFISYELFPIEEEINKIKEMAKIENLNFIVKIEDSRKCVIEDTDVLFIDTEHNYEQLYTELTKHANNVRHKIIMHDTETFPKMTSALYDFLNSHQEWEVELVKHNNNGLTIIRRLP